MQRRGRLSCALAAASSSLRDDIRAWRHYPSFAPLPLSEQDRHFFTLRTVKEAYPKARGVGLSLALDCFAIEPRANGSAELELLSAHPPEPHPWAFGWWQLDTQCAVVAVQTESKRLRQVVFEEEPF